MTTQRIAELETEVMRLREAVSDLLEFAIFSTCGKQHAVESAKEALSTPCTPQALTKIIEKVEKMTIERCAGICHRFGERQMHPLEAEGAIRALPVGQIKLEELL